MDVTLSVARASSAEFFLHEYVAFREDQPLRGYYSVSFIELYLKYWHNPIVHPQGTDERLFHSQMANYACEELAQNECKPKYWNY